MWRCHSRVVPRAVMSSAAHTLLGLSTSSRAARPPCRTQGARPLPTNSLNAPELSPTRDQQHRLLPQLRGSHRPPNGSCPGCSLCSSARHRGSTSSSRSAVSLSPAAGRGPEAPTQQRWGTAQPRSAEIHATAPPTNPLPPSHNLPSSAGSHACTAPSSRSRGQAGSSSCPLSPATAAKSKLCSRLPAGR